MSQSQSPENLYRDYASTPEKLYHDGKNRAMLRSLRPLVDLCFNKSLKFCWRPSVDYAAFTNANRRAVSSQRKRLHKDIL